MIKIVGLGFLLSFSASCYADFILVKVERTEGAKVEQITGLCEHEGKNLACQLTEITIRNDKSVCKVSSRQYKLILKPQSVRTWTRSNFSEICNTDEVISVELLRPSLFPGVLKYTIKSTVENRKNSPKFCSDIKDDETLIYAPPNMDTPSKARCDTVEFAN
jgi:hypothetical protein